MLSPRIGAEDASGVRPTRYGEDMTAPGTGPEELYWEERPTLEQPVLLAAFEGWNDAGDAASLALGWLADAWGVRTIASIDPDGFYDFTSTRPQVQFDAAGAREIVWPENRFAAATKVQPELDVVLLTGVEPGLRWRRYCDVVLALADDLGARLVVTMGALLAEIPHSRPTQVFGTAYAPDVVERLGLEASSYQGPTGIVGVLHDACTKAGIDSAGFWATVPTYVASAPSPKAALALVHAVTGFLDAPVTPTELEIAAAGYDRQVDELVAEDEDTTDYVRRLEARWDEADEFPTPGSLADEVERYLRDQN